MLDAAADAFDALERRLGLLPASGRSGSSSRPAAYGMESPGLIWIPTGTAARQPALPRRPRDGAPVVLRDRRQRPVARAVRRRGRRRLRGALHPRPAADQPLRDGDAGPLDLRVLGRLLLREDLHPGRQPARRRAAPDGLDRVLGGAARLRRGQPEQDRHDARRCSTRSTPGRRSISGGRCSGRASRGSTDRRSPTGRVGA